ncbi:MAG: DNA polymerase III subunit beta [Chitinophagia bacterium]|nr:DNA polymerase III subunit beta [Chitinophagia bacterium]
MKFIVSSGLLLKNLQQISGIISSNAVLAVLEDFLFELNGNELTISATDLETMMRVKMEVGETDGDGKICIPSKILLDYLKNLPEQPITVLVNEEDLQLDIITDAGKCRITGERAADFPREAAAEETSELTMDTETLLKSINKTLFAVSTDTLRPAMNGVYLEMLPDCISFVATDAHRLMEYKRTDISCPKEDGIIIPKKPLSQLKSHLPSESGSITIRYNASHFFVNSDRFSLSCRLIDAKFPNYKAVIPQENPYHLTVNRLDFAGVIRRVSIFANKTTNQIKLNIMGSSLEISAQDLDYSYDGKETLSCQYTGEDMMIAFNAKLLVELVSNMDANEITMELSTPNRAAIFKPSTAEDNVNVLALLMPLMIGL